MTDLKYLTHTGIKKTVISVIWCFFILFLTSVSGQNTIQERQLYMSQLGVEHGLSSGGINSLVECRKKYLWIGTPDGLNRYDGYRVKKYLNEPGNPNSLIDSYISKIFIDSRGLMWVLTMSNGLHVYNEITDDFLRIPIDGIQISLFEDQNGDIWCHAGQKGYAILEINPKFNLENLLGLTLDDISMRTQEEVYPNLTKEILKGEISFCEISGLWLYKSDTLFNFNLNKKKRDAKLLYKTVTKKIHSPQLVLNPNKDQILILGKNNLLIFNRLSKKLLDSIDLPKEVGFTKAIQLIDRKNRLWMFVNGSFCRLNLDTRVWEKITLQREGPRKNQLKYAINIIQDSHHNIWIGTKGFGVFKHSDLNDFFNYYGSDRAGPFVHSIRDYDDNSVIFNVENEASILQIFNYKNNTSRAVSLPKNLFYPLVESSFAVFFKDSKQRYWIPSKQVDDKGYKILLLDKNLKLIDEIESPSLNNNEKKALITYIFETKDGQIWGVGSVNQGNELLEYPDVYLSKWSEKNNKFTIENVFYDHPTGFVFNQCITSRETQDGILWLGFESGGLLKYNLTKKTWKHFFKTNTSNQLPTSSILSSHESLEHPRTNFWLGTRNGLIDFNFINETFEVYNKEDGLLDNVIYGILADYNNNLWLSTNKGINLFNGITRRGLTSFSVADGLQSLEFNRRAFHKRKDGTFFFGGVGGLSWFNPKKFKIKPDDATIEITGLKLNNKTTNKLLTKKKHIKLPYNHSLITFEFAKINMTSSYRNQYAYKLEKNNDSQDWVEIGSKTSLTFSKLPPDHYKFHIGTYDENGKIARQQNSVMFTVNKPWWDNNWLKFLLFLGLIALGYYLYFVKIKSKIKLQKLKNSISRDLHDEIGSTLSSITIYGTIAEKELESNPERARKLIKKINSHSTSSIESMNDIIWAIRSGSETIAQLIKRVRFYFTEIEETGKWKTSINYDKSISNYSLDSINMRNLYLIIKEGINNALKHSEGNTIDIRFINDNKGKFIIIEIEDNGLGIDLKNIDVNESNGLVNMKQRAKELNGTLEFISLKDKGLKIKLTFSKKLKKLKKI